MCFTPSIFPRFLTVVRIDCDIVCDVPVVHLTHICLSTSDFRIPTVTVPMNSKTKNAAGRCAREIGLGHSAEGQMKVVALAASRFQWSRILLHTDEERSTFVSIIYRNTLYVYHY